MLTGLDILMALFLAIPLGVEFHFNAASFLLAFIQFFTSLYGLALLMSLLMISLRDTFFIQNTIIPLVLLTGGYLFPVDVLPLPLRVLAELIPVHRGVEMFREAVLLGRTIPFDRLYLLSLVPGIILLLAGYLLLPLIERKALENYLS